MSARRTANKPRERARHQVVNWRRSSAYASRVRPRYPARNPASARRSASVKAGWIVTRAVDGAAVVIGYLPAGLRPGRLGQLRIPAIERKPSVSRVSRSQHVTTRQESGRCRQPEIRARSPIIRSRLADAGRWWRRADYLFGGGWPPAARTPVRYCTLRCLFDRSDRGIQLVRHPHQRGVRPADDLSVCRWLAVRCWRADPPGADRPAVAGHRRWDLRRLTAEVESSSGVGLVDARPGRALKLVAPEPEPIFVAQEVLADAEAKAEGDSVEAILLGRAPEWGQMSVRQTLVGGPTTGPRSCHATARHPSGEPGPRRRRSARPGS